MDAVVNAEKATMFAPMAIVQCDGYAAGSEVPVATKVYSTAGTVTGASGSTMSPGEVVALVRYSTAARSTKNHPIYAFNYYHHVMVNPGSAGIDLLDTNQKGAFGTYAAAWIAGFSDGTITAVRATPAGHLATGQVVEEYVTHRDFPPTRSL
jgi:hypothetical protein